MKEFTTIRLFGCLVYVAWGKDGSCLYVGRSIRGLRRPATNEVLLKQIHLIRNIEIAWCEDGSESESLEIELIRKYRPAWNKVQYVGSFEHGMRTFLLKLDDDVHAAWLKASKADGKSLSEWIRIQCNRNTKSPAREVKVKDDSREGNRTAPPARVGNTARGERRDRSRRGPAVPRGKAASRTASTAVAHRNNAGQPLRLDAGQVHSCDSPTCRICQFRRNVKGSRK